MQTLKDQYKLIQDSREAVFGYFDIIEYDDLITQIESFNKASIQYLILHVANTYLFWIKQFTFKEEIDYFTEDNTHGINDIRKAFDEVNILVEKFISKFNDYNAPVQGEIFWLKKNMTFSVLELFTHVITHEFHHKGQIMTMSRVLGYTPLDEDIIRF